jgi:hypothetical protein
LDFFFRFFRCWVSWVFTGFWDFFWKIGGFIWENRGFIWENRGFIWENRGFIWENRGFIWENNWGFIWEKSLFGKIGVLFGKIIGGLFGKKVYLGK